MSGRVDGELVRKLRLVKSWSQEELAQIAGLSARTVQRIEAEGVGALDTRRALAAAFGLQPADLLERDPGGNDAAFAAAGFHVERPAVGLDMGIFWLVTLIIVTFGLALSIAWGAFAGSAWVTVYGIFCLGGLAYHGYFLWACLTTSYRVSAGGLSIRFGLQQREYDWSEFESAFHHRGPIPFKMTFLPCTRLSHPVVLKSRSGGSTLELTPDNPEAFLRRITALAPQLAQEGDSR